MVIRNISFHHMRRAAFFLREEGLKSTLRRSRLWLQTNGRGQARSIVPSTSGKQAGPAGFGGISAFWADIAAQCSFDVSAPDVLRQRRKVAVIADLNLPQCRKYRVEQLAEIFAEAGADFAYSHHEDLPRCMDIMQDATHLLLYRLRSTPMVTQHLYEARRLKLPILYDIDDPLFSVPAYATYGNMAALPPDLKAHFMAEAPFYADVMNMADAMSVSTPALQEHARSFTSRPVFLRRNFADQSTLAARPVRDGSSGDGKFRVAFASGSHGHEIDFAEIGRDIECFLANDTKRRLVILGHFDKSRLSEGIRAQVEMHPFSGYADYLGHLSACDAAIMPLADDLFNRCKSGVRVIDASSVGVASLVGDVSDMPALVEDGRTGRVLPKGSNWAEALEELARTPGRVRAMGDAARQHLENQWSARLEAPVVDDDMVRWVMA